jgi:hypothetical protein
VVDRGANPIRLRWVSQRTDGTEASVDAEGWDPHPSNALARRERSVADWQAILVVRVIQDGPQGAKEPVPPLTGRYQFDGTTLRFTPRYPLEPGMTYRAELAGERGKPPVVADFKVPSRKPSAPSGVTGVFPSAAVLPENLLRFYIHFSAPMSRGQAYRNIHLVESTGRAIDLPFLELDEELWSRDGLRFTLLFDPGRIKRGLKPREELGPVLEAGRTYELVIDSAWLDAEGKPLSKPFRKSFRVTEPDDRSPDPKQWRIKPPAAGGRERLELRFPESLDRALLDRMIRVQDASGRAIEGNLSVAEHETFWTFEPLAAWKTGDYRLVIGTDLEDLAGNSVARPFEVDVVTPLTTRVSPARVEIPFQVR